VVGERVGDVARGEREFAGALGAQPVLDLEDQLALEHVERLVEVVRVQGRTCASGGNHHLHHRDMTGRLLAV